MSYWVCLVARDSDQTIKSTIDSILNQSLKPELICVVDDGSTDDTPKILQKYVKAHPNLFQLITHADMGYDIRRVPQNINEGYRLVQSSNRRFQYAFITGGDCVYPPNYLAYLIDQMEKEPKLVIVSGDRGVKPPPDTTKAPQGSGRLIRESFWRRVGGRYPPYYGWEAWALFKAAQLGYQVKNFTEMKFQHLHRGGSAHGFRYWGAGMRALGYHPLFVLMRFLKNMLVGGEPIPLKGNLMMILSYLFPPQWTNDQYFRMFELDLRRFVREHQARRIGALVRRTFRLFVT